MEWFDLAQDRDRWRTVVIAVMNLHGPQTARSFLVRYYGFYVSKC